MEIKRFGYYWLDTWVLANVIQLATQDFCMHYLNRKNDPCGRQYDQMTQAARSVPANQLSSFKEEGGFTEALTADRLAYRTAQSVQADAPACPKCGKPMIKRVARKGVNSGKEFWSCSGYPNCNGTRSLRE